MGSAVVNVRDNGGTCEEYCSKQGLSCLDSWDDATNEQCSLDATKVGCSYSWTGTSDAICECTPKTCDPASWTGYDGSVCGDCSAVVKVRDNGGTCQEYCSKQGLGCIDSWDDAT